MSTVTPTSAPSRRIGEQVRYWLPAVVVFGLGLAAWQWLLPDVLGVEEFLLPRFSDVVQALVDERDKLLRGAWITFKEAFGGFVLGSGAAIVAALVLARWRPFGNALMPYMIAANAIPIIAFAPITNAWFGLLSPWSKVTIAAVLCFFPVLVNTLRGLTSVDPESLPYVFSALKVASVLAMIGAVVGDYFGGSLEALGIVVLSAVNLSQYSTSWAAILVASIMGIAFYGAIALVERYALSWHPSVGRRVQ
jgi:NitT/TauT family transport system permease protein